MKIKYYLLLILVSVTFSVNAEITLPRLISDGVVFQRNTEVKIWGWASVDENITLSFKNKKYKTRADGNGNWSLLLPPQKAGGPYDLVFKGENEIRVSNVLFGDVWLCSGQSNMVLPMERIKEKYPDEIENSNFPEIRNFFIPTTTNLQGPANDLPPGSWKEANSKDVLTFSGTAYFFAKKIYQKYKIPIGLINASVGGTPIEAWISEKGYKEFPEILKSIEKNKDTAYVNSFRKNRPAFVRKKPSDKGLTESPKWFDVEYRPKGWHAINIPGYWEDQGVKNLNGVVWYRKEIDVPEVMTGVPVKLFMGRIVDADFVYVNGQQVGNITYQYPPRRYEIPSGVLKEGKNIIVVRVINNNGKGGFVPDKPYYLTANGEEIDLKGTWQYKVGEVYQPMGFRGFGFSAQNQPASLYNAMIAPFVNHKIKGILWYQGESNSGRPAPYRRLLPALINDWRNIREDQELPFLYVQLANFMDVNYLPEESKWAELRDAQLSALTVPNTAMTVAIDLGEWNDIHPLNKKGIGERLALGALKIAYDEDIVHSGPIYRSHSIKGNKIVVEFSETGSGLVSNDNEELRRFEIAGHDGKFVWANAVIEGEQVIVWNEKIKKPVMVRYAWSDNPRDANLYNKEGLPASPFQTQNINENNEKLWMGKKCAVVLTYDDGLNVHLDNAISLMDSLGLNGTFYIPGNAASLTKRIYEWRKASRKGHELGNHTLFHPCDGQKPGRAWVNPDYDLSNYSVKRIVDEIKQANVLLKTVDGKDKRTFAFTCGDMYAGDEFFADRIKNDFVAARGVRSKMNNVGDIDINNVDSYMINGESGEQLINMAKKAMKSNSLLVFLFHGVGGEHNLDVSLEAHRELLYFLKNNEDIIWTTTMLQAAEHILKHQ